MKITNSKKSNKQWTFNSKKIIYKSYKELKKITKNEKGQQK